MPDDALRAHLRGSEGRAFRFTFADGRELVGEVVSATYVDADGSLMVVPRGASPAETAWNLHLDDLHALAEADGAELYRQG